MRINRQFITPAVLLFTALLLSGIALSRPFSGFYWSGWYPLLIPHEQVGEQVLTGLGQEIADFIYEGNSVYFYNGFNERKELLTGRDRKDEGLYEGDPRLDPFISGAGKYFRQERYSVFYLPADRSSIEYRYGLKDLWQDAWVLPDTVGFSLVFILAGLFSVFLLIRAGRTFIPGLLIFLYGISALIHGDRYIFIPGLLALLFLSQYRNAGKFRYFITISIPLTGILALAAGFFTFPDCIALLLVFISGFFIPVEQREKNGSKKKPVKSGSNRDHELFTPVPLSGRSHEALFRERNSAGITAFVPVLVQAVLLVLIFFMAGRNRAELPVELPSVLYSQGNGWSWNALDELPLTGDLPGVGEMVMHRAYQEGLPYGETWGLPGEGDTVNLPVYTLENGRIKSSVKVVLTFDQLWLERVFREMPLEGPGALFRSERQIPVTGLTRDVPDLMPGKGRIEMVLLMILGILLSLMNTGGQSADGSEEFRMRNHLYILRRKQQAA